MRPPAAAAKPLVLGQVQCPVGITTLRAMAARHFLITTESRVTFTRIPGLDFSMAVAGAADEALAPVASFMEAGTAAGSTAVAGDTAAGTAAIADHEPAPRRGSCMATTPRFPGAP
jgi:hypothetical protein